MILALLPSAIPSVASAAAQRQSSATTLAEPCFEGEYCLYDFSLNLIAKDNVFRCPSVGGAEELFLGGVDVYLVINNIDRPVRGLDENGNVLWIVYPDTSDTFEFNQTYLVDNCGITLS